MSDFKSGLALSIEGFLHYREALGYSKKSYYPHFKNFDAFCERHYPECSHITKEMALNWLDEQVGALYSKATMLRLLGMYLNAIEKESFVMPYGMCREKKSFTAYVFTDDELKSLFRAADATPAHQSEPFLPEMLPVMLRLIYTCGLRPNEGRELLCVNINFKNGEVIIINTKHKKDRLVVMSGDMLRLCKKYNERRNVFARGSEYFFPSWNGGALTNRQLNVFFKGCWKRANPGIDAAQLPNVRVYDLRHRFASAVMTRWLDSGQPLGVKLPYLRAFMGHSTLNETAHYIHLLPENLIKSSGIDWRAFDEIVPSSLKPAVIL
jgi:integrase